MKATMKIPVSEIKKGMIFRKPDGVIVFAEGAHKNGNVYSLYWRRIGSKQTDGCIGNIPEDALIDTQIEMLQEKALAKAVENTIVRAYNAEREQYRKSGSQSLSQKAWTELVELAIIEYQLGAQGVLVPEAQYTKSKGTRVAREEISWAYPGPD